ncbi:MAG TPA: PRC-barrel domain-containing protein [Solirubrobacterales bacterium]|nr:PRC-barrel domain-containing protein [Solirubrobacterales bacterium]
MELSGHRALSELLGRKVIDRSGRPLGRVYEVKGRWQPDRTIVVEGLILGRAGLWRRLRGPGTHGVEVIPWEAVVSLEDEHVVVRL